MICSQCKKPYSCGHALVQGGASGRCWRCDTSATKSTPAGIPARRRRKVNHPSGHGGYGWSALFIGSGRDPRHTIITSGTMHHVTRREEWTNPAGVTFTDWTARCGKTGRRDGTRFANVHGARVGKTPPGIANKAAGRGSGLTHVMLCRPCFLPPWNDDIDGPWPGGSVDHATKQRRLSRPVNTVHTTGPPGCKRPPR